MDNHVLVSRDSCRVLALRCLLRLFIAYPLGNRQNRFLCAGLLPTEAMARSAASDADYFRDKARRDLLTLLEAVSKAPIVCT